MAQTPTKNLTSCPSYTLMCSISGCHVMFHVDNSAVIDAINNRTIRSSPTMSLLRLIVMIATCLDMSFSSSWLLSHANAIADAASCYQYKQPVQAALHARPLPQPLAIYDGPLGCWYQTHPALSTKCAFLLWHGSRLQHATHTALGSTSSLTSSSSTLTWPTLTVLHYQLPSLQS